MAWVHPPTRTTGDLITAANWNQDVKDNTLWEARDHFRVEVTSTSNQTITSGTGVTTVTFTTEIYDFGAMFTIGTSNTTITIPTFPTGITTALAEVGGTVEWADNSTGTRGLDILDVTNTLVVIGDQRTGDRGTQVHVSRALQVTPGQQFRMRVRQVSGANLALQGTTATAAGTRMWCRWLAWQG